MSEGIGKLDLRTDSIIFTISPPDNEFSPQPKVVPISLIPLLVILKVVNSTNTADLPYLVMAKGDLITNQTTKVVDKRILDIVNEIKGDVSPFEPESGVNVVVLKLDSQDDKESIAIILLRGDDARVHGVYILDIYSKSRGVQEGVIELSIDSRVGVDNSTVFNFGGSDIKPLLGMYVSTYISTQYLYTHDVRFPAILPFLLQNTTYWLPAVRPYLCTSSQLTCSASQCPSNVPEQT